MKLMVNPGLCIQPFHGESEMPLALCEVPDQSGRPRRYVVPRQLCDLFSTCDGKLERTEAIALMAERSEGRYTAEQLEQLADQFLIPRHLLIDTAAASKPVISAPRLDRYLYFKVRFLKKELVQPLAQRLEWLFHPYAWKILLTLSLVSHVWFYLVLTHHQLPKINALPNSSLPLFLLVFSFGGMLHEFGHATALARFGGKNAEIGFGVYICFAALFVDLSDAWRFTNRQRVIVDLSGMYFQAILLIFMAVAYALTGSPVWACGFVFTDFELAANLNPLLRLDGYWALADGLGIPNLRSRSLRYFLPMLLGRGQPDLAVQFNSRTRKIMQVYLVSTLVFSMYLAYAVALQCIAVVEDYPRVFRSALQSWHSADWLNACSFTFAALWRGLLLAGLVIAIYRAAVWLARNVGRSAFFQQTFTTRTPKELSL